MLKITKKIELLLTGTNYTNGRKHGFGRKYLARSNMLDFYESKQNLKKKKRVVCVILDYQMDFDYVPDRRLIKLDIQAGVRGSLSKSTYRYQSRRE